MDPLALNTFCSSGKVKDCVYGQQNIELYSKIRLCVDDNAVIWLSNDRLVIYDGTAKCRVRGKVNINSFINSEFDASERHAALECAVCFKEARRRVAYSCGHMAVCQECDKRLKACPLCRSPIVLRLNVILP